MKVSFNVGFLLFESLLAFSHIRQWTFLSICEIDLDSIIIPNISLLPKDKNPILFSQSNTSRFSSPMPVGKLISLCS